MIQSGDMINNRYHVIKELGSGGFAKTFEVKDKAENDHKVIKILQDNAYSHPKVRELFAREYDILKRLDHPGIPGVKIDGYVTITYNQNSQVFTIPGLVMEKIDGENLQQWLKINTKIINTQQAIQWLKELIDILDYVHNHQYVHRDIKPSNIMLKPNGKLVLIDFGIVKELSQQYEKQNVPATKIGTPGYAAPEQENATLPTWQTWLANQNHQFDHRADFFCLGRTFVHLLTGIEPTILTIDSRNGKLLWRDKATGIDEDFKDLIDWLMEYKPDKRPQNTQEIKDLLEPKPAIIFPVPMVFFSFALNFVLLALLAMGVTLTIGWKVLFVVILCVIGGFFVKPLMKYFQD
ncbi:serine/threonine protein kinase [Anabaena sp. FACHB-1237]|uniref:serine/threonine protein kinase n=1 Tax=Anabaena sp. FACHB-1237 TaxID=2692769 RepID=UPI0016800DD3|nr:serine/threonine-protein kinase [Anabaena sp. FACHB-1237]MBD2138487.1 serine/threonine protein kinase [Anabaena sp. FACHB-1237]